MATKTIILRPNGTYVSSYYENLTRFPSETDDMSLHLLVSESEADDDATYVQAPSGNTLYLYFPTYEISGTFLEAKVFCRFKTSATTLGIGLGENYADIGTMIASATDIYETHSVAISEGSLNHIIKGGSDLKINFETIGGSSVSKGKLTLTQVYIEIKYDDGGAEPDPEPTPVSHIFKKINGVWDEYTATYYKKQNNEWVSIAVEELSEGQYPSVYIT